MSPAKNNLLRSQVLETEDRIGRFAAVELGDVRLPRVAA
jgi:hypothetical protein